MTLVELLVLIRKNIRLVVILPIVCALVVAAYSTLIIPVTYTATTAVYALARSANDSSSMLQQNDFQEGITSGDLQLAQMLANDFAELVESNQIQRTVAKNLGIKSLGGYTITVTSTTTSRLLTISVTGGDAEEAPAIANELATVLGDTAIDVLGVEAVSVVNEATSPAPRSGPPRKRYTLVAFAAGLFAAVAAAVLRDMLNTTVRDENEIQELSGFSVVGRFPYEKGAAK